MRVGGLGRIPDWLLNKIKKNEQDINAVATDLASLQEKTLTKVTFSKVVNLAVGTNNVDLSSFIPDGYTVISANWSWSGENYGYIERWGWGGSVNNIYVLRLVSSGAYSFKLKGYFIIAKI